MLHNYFVAFNITHIPRNHNETIDSLALAATHFRIPKTTQLRYPIEVRYRPCVLDNVRHWRVFEDDIEIKKFLELTDEFTNAQIDQEEDEGDEQLNEFAENESAENDSAENKFAEHEIAGHKIIELKSNFIPKVLVPLERIFTKDDTASKLVVQSSEDNVVDCNIGSAEHPKMVKISKSLTAEQRNRYIKLLKEHVDVFSWSYGELRTYDTTIIQHKVPLKPNVKPFRQKLRRINPDLFPVIEKEVKKLLYVKIIMPLRYSS